MGEVEFLHDPLKLLTAQQLWEQHGHHLPLMVLVVQGFLSNREEMCFSNGQVLRLQELRQQRRALVHDEQKKTLSVPLDYSHHFYVGHDTSNPMTIEEIVDRHKLPVKIRFASPNMRFDCGPDHDTRSFSTLKIIRQHEETYFIANFVVQGQLQETVIPIPMYLKEVRFSLVTGVRGRGLKDGGRDLMQALLHSQAQNLDFSQDHGDTEMVQLSEKPIKATDNIYQNIETNIYINVQEQRQRQQRQQPQSASPLAAAPPQSHGQQQQQHTSHQQQQQQQQLQRQRQQPEQQLYRRRQPLPPRPPDDSYTASKTSAQSVAAEGEYMNISDLQGSGLISELTPPPDGDREEGGEWDGHCTEDVYEDVHGEVSVYETFESNSSQKGTANMYTALEQLHPGSPSDGQPAEQTATAQFSIASELLKALQKRKERAATGHDVEQGTQLHANDPSCAPGPPVSGKQDTPHRNKDPPDNQSPWGVRLRPVQTKLSMTPKPDSSAAATTAAAVAASAAAKPEQEGSKPASRPPQLATKAPPSPSTIPPPTPTSQQQTPSGKPTLKKKPALSLQKPPPPGKPAFQSRKADPGRRSAEKGSTGDHVPHITGASAFIHAEGAGSGGSQPEPSAQNARPAPSLVRQSQRIRPTREPIGVAGSPTAGGDAFAGTDTGREPATYVNQKEMAVIAPTRSAGGRGQGQGQGLALAAAESVGDKRWGVSPVNQASPTQTKCHQQQLLDITTNITNTNTNTSELKPSPTAPLPLALPVDRWTIGDVQQLLTCLNLTRHAADFQDQQVDGRLLQQLSQSILVNEFGMSAVGAIKLRSFVQTGHLPK